MSERHLHAVDENEAPPTQRSWFSYVLEYLLYVVIVLCLLALAVTLVRVIV